ncbi:S-adenosyl-L-methionine-dependent methyltransferase [Trichophaea hybrida]|nr:S-adenosyl-L-methionine-dependent methyltransferase [Trichophaea hybrida]
MSETITIEVDPALLENDDSDYESSGYDTSTQSLTSSINEYVMENGRRYHSYYGTEKNPLPTDENRIGSKKSALQPEPIRSLITPSPIYRLDMCHEIFLLLLNRELHQAPLKNPQRIMDVGTGTGIWAIDMADKYSEAEVIGTDLSPIQPKWVPPNCRFEVDDAEQKWTHKSDSFDFIHSRCLGQAITDWPTMMSEMYRCTKPGGYVELSEGGGIMFSDDGTGENGAKRYLEFLEEAMVKSGRPSSILPEHLKGYLEGAGFVDIKIKSIKQPWGPWAKNTHLKYVGAMILAASESGVSAYGMAAFTRILGMSIQEAERVCDEALKAVKNKNNHMYSYYHIAYGRKPDRIEGSSK